MKDLTEQNIYISLPEKPLQLSPLPAVVKSVKAPGLHRTGLWCEQRLTEIVVLDKANLLPLKTLISYFNKCSQTGSVLKGPVGHAVTLTLTRMLTVNSLQNIKIPRLKQSLSSHVIKCS